MLDFHLSFYLVACAGLGMVMGAVGWPFPMHGFFLPQMYLIGIALTIGAFSVVFLTRK